MAYLDMGDSCCGTYNHLVFLALYFFSPPLEMEYLRFKSFPFCLWNPIYLPASKAQLGPYGTYWNCTWSLRNSYSNDGLWE